MSTALHPDELYHSITPAELRFASRSALYLANQSVRPNEIRDTLIEELELPAPMAESIIYQLFTGAPADPALERAA